MIGETILHYPPKADEPQAHNILEKLGEVRLVPVNRDGRDLVPIRTYSVEGDSL